MITNEQATKISAIEAGAITRMSGLLSHFPIADHNSVIEFELEVFLFALASIAFPENREDLMEAERQSITLYAGAGKDIRRRLKLYEAAAAGEIMPCGFWSMAPIDTLLSNPTLRAFAMFGDFLVCADSAKDYGCHPWPRFRHKDLAVFTSVFTTRVLAEATKYVAAIAGVLREEG